MPTHCSERKMCHSFLYLPCRVSFVVNSQIRRIDDLSFPLSPFLSFKGLYLHQVLLIYIPCSNLTFSLITASLEPTHVLLGPALFAV